MPKIKKSDLFGKIDLKGEIKSLKAMLEVVQNFQEQVKEMAKQKLSDVVGLDPTTLKGLKDLNQAMEEAAKLQKQTDELKKKEIQTKKKLNELTEEELTQKIKEQQLAAERKKNIKDDIVLTNKEAGTIERLEAQNRKLRREKKKLNLETEEGRRLNQQYNKTIEENSEVIRENSDAVVKQKMNIGNYQSALEDADKLTGGIAGKIEAMTSAVKEQAQAFRDAAKGADTFGKKAKLAGKAGAAIGLTVLVTLLGMIASAFGDSRKEADEMATAMNRISGQIQVLGGAFYKFAKGGLAELLNQFRELKVTFYELIGDDGQVAELNGLIEKSRSANEGWQDALNGVTDRMKNMDKITGGLAEKIRRFDEDIIFSDQRLQEYNNTLEKLEEQAGDGTLAFEKQAEAQAKIAGVLDEIDAENKLRAELKQAILLEKVNKDLADTKRQLTIEDVKSLDILKDKQIADELSAETLQEFVQTTTDIKQAELDLSKQRQTLAKTERETNRDVFEDQLDFAIDVFDAQKMVNERIISDDKKTLAERTKVADDTRKLADKSFQNQIKLVDDFVGQKVGLDELVKESDEAVVRERLKQFEIDKTTLTRILEIIRERKAAVQDLVDIDNDLTQTQIDNQKAIADSAEAIRADDQEREIEKLENALELKKAEGKVKLEEEKKFNEDIQNEQIKQLEAEAEFAKERAEEEIVEADVLAAKKKEIEEKLANDIERIKQETAKKNADLEREARIQSIENAQQTYKAIAQIVTDNMNERKKVLDQEYQQSVNQEQDLQQLAQQGINFAEDALATEKKNQAEIQREQAKIAKKQQLIKASEAALDLMASYAKGGSKTPFRDAFADLTKMFSALRSIQFFADGTESVEGGVQGKDSVPAMLMPKERVFTVDQNKMIGDISNDEAARVLQAYNQGAFNSRLVPLMPQAYEHSNKELTEQLKNVERAVKNIPATNIDHHAIAGFITETIRTQNSIDRKHYKPNQIFK